MDRLAVAGWTALAGGEGRRPVAESVQGQGRVRDEAEGSWTARHRRG
ncbi:hypothetical protein E2C01_078438 [Portunus trituberculatus]|uniref:Uncharacterized protein n=1 Tax=Portunus trituberculatus TaxID=210409 RepID=A0A5B7IIR9_PORTR|nr:hypothetical protein [Portunus trituberculatus]